ncbi:MAG: DUF3781 domain-containing protein [Desulfotalea sp.]
MNEDLRSSIANQFRNTTLGFLRIKKNLGLSHSINRETENYLKEIILATPLDAIEQRGKNYYFKSVLYNAVLTVNSYTYTVITAKKITTN